MDATLFEDLRRLLEPTTKGDPMRPLLWVSKSHAKLAAALRDGAPDCQEQHSQAAGAAAIPPAGVNRKTLEGSRNPDRDAQFEHINAAVTAMQSAGQPVISVDTKKKELIGPYKNGGSDYREGCPEQVNVHDFVDAGLGKVVSYGVYDITANAGWVSVGIDNDTAQFSVNSIRRWLDVQNWRGTPLTSRSAVVELIASTTSKTGLKVRCELDTRAYAKGIKVSDDEMATLNITADTFHPEWNYSISPRRPL
jgi:hypothetical protein